MAAIKSRVVIDSRFREVSRKWERAIEEGLEDAARVGAQVSERVASQRRRSGQMADIKIGPVRKATRGRAAGSLYVTFFSTAWWYVFHEKGTKNLRALRFLAKGRAAARKVLLAAIERHMQRVR